MKQKTTDREKKTQAQLQTVILDHLAYFEILSIVTLLIVRTN